MDLVGEERGRLARAAGWLEATRAELVGLGVLLVGAVAATGALWWAAMGPAAPVPAPTAVGAPVGPHDHGGIGAGGDEAGGSGHHQHDPGRHGPGLAGAGGRAAAGDDTSAGQGTAAGSAAAQASRLTVHVTGAVAESGVVTVPGGARVADAIAAAGGATSEAEVHLLNLARVLQDGEQIHVPREGEDPPPHVGPAAGDGHQAGGAGQDADTPVDLNRADAATLETLPGIGPARAQAIIEHRESHGPFADPGDLRDVSGIGEATFQRLADRVVAP